MKRTAIIATILASALCSCTKEQAVAVKADGDTLVPIAFKTSGDFEVTATKVTDVTELSSIYVSATSGAAGSAEAQFSDMKNKSITLSGGQGSSTYFWPASGTLNFYATSWSVTPTVAASGLTCDVTAGTTDYVAGFARSVANKTNPVELTLNHIFGRLYDVKFSCATGVTATINSVKVTPAYSAGTYTFATNTIAGKTAGSEASVTLATTSFSGSTATSVGQANVDRLVIPGNVTIEVKYTATRTGYSKQFTKTATVNLPKGQKSVVTGTLTDDAAPISFSVTINPWTGPTEVAGTFN